MESNNCRKGSVTRYRWAVLLALGGAIVLNASTASAQAEALMTAAHAAICGPEVKNVVVAGHGFNIKRAIIVTNTTTGRPHQLSVTINHRLSWRPDDDVHCVVPYNADGVPQPANCVVDPGGFADLIPIFGAIVQVLPAFGVNLPQVKIPTTGHTIDLAKINFAQIAQALVVAFGNVQWQDAGRAIVAAIGLGAITTDFCTPPPTPFCGDNACGGSETCASCSTDCGTCDPACASSCGSQASSCHGQCGMNNGCHASCDSQLASCMAQC